MQQNGNTLPSCRELLTRLLSEHRLDRVVIRNEVDFLVAGNASGGAAFRKGEIGEDEIDPPGFVFPLFVGPILRKKAGGEGAALEFSGGLLGVDEVDQPEGEELGHDGGVRVGVPSAALGGLFVDGFLILGSCVEPLLVERGVAIKVSEKEG